MKMPSLKKVKAKLTLKIGRVSVLISFEAETL